MTMLMQLHTCSNMHIYMNKLKQTFRQIGSALNLLVSNEKAQFRMGYVLHAALLLQAQKPHKPREEITMRWTFQYGLGQATSTVTS